jgi:fermentation-respiration switch protein FrsA (DUF1100 family)
MFQVREMRILRPSRTQIVLGTLSSGMVITGIIVAVAFSIVEKIIHPKKKTPFDRYTVSPFELDIPAETVAFPPLCGDYHVNGWYLSHPEATTTILVCPGFHTRAADVLAIGAHLWRAGHNVLVFEYYGHGIAGGTSVTLGYCEVNDFEGAVAYAKERAPQTHLGVLAYSMGAAVAIMCSACNYDIEALVADSAFATHKSAVDYNFHHALRMPSAPFMWLADYLLWWRAGYRFRQVEPLRDIGDISPRPILIIHGEKDSIVNPRDAEQLYEAAREPKEVWLVPDAEHCGAYFADRKAYVAKVNDFFDLHLRKARPRLRLVGSS